MIINESRWEIIAHYATIPISIIPFSIDVKVIAAIALVTSLWVYVKAPRSTLLAFESCNYTYYFKLHKHTFKVHISVNVSYFVFLVLLDLI